MATTIIFEHPQTGLIKQAPVGFSWTTMLFTGFPALMRGDVKWGVIQLILAVLTWGLSTLVFMFIYNKLYITDLVQTGYRVKSVVGGNMEFVNAQLGMALPMLENNSQ